MTKKIKSKISKKAWKRIFKFMKKNMALVDGRIG